MGAWFVWMLTFIDLDGGGRILDFSQGREPCLLLGLEREEKVPELALSHSHTDEYLAYHHRTFIWRWMKTETESHIGALDLAPYVQMRSRWRENMSKDVRITTGASTH